MAVKPGNLVGLFCFIQETCKRGKKDGSICFPAFGLNFFGLICARGRILPTVQCQACQHTYLSSMKFWNMSLSPAVCHIDNFYFWLGINCLLCKWLANLGKVVQTIYQLEQPWLLQCDEKWVVHVSTPKEALIQMIFSIIKEDSAYLLCKKMLSVLGLRPSLF